MFTSNKFRIFVFISIMLFTFTVWFADGYLQWINSDTAGEAYLRVQNIAFPQGLVSEKYHHSRLAQAIIHYIPFHTVGYLFRELTGNPVNALYVSQGVMSGSIFLLFLLISSAYISFSAPILSLKYIATATFLMLFMMALPHSPIDAPISLVFRYGHQTLTVNYVGTMIIALFAVFPYWRYLFCGKWDDWYSDIKLRTAFYIVIIAAIFSCTSTMLWLGTFALMTFLAFIYTDIYAKKRNVKTIEAINNMLKDSKVYPLIIMIVLFIIGVAAESTSERGSSALSGTYLSEYLKVYGHFFISRSAMLYIVACLPFALLIMRQYQKGTISTRLHLLVRIFPWLVIGNLIFIFFIGIPKIPYRFSGYNLGPDTVFPATCSMALWLASVIFECWRKNKLNWLSPLMLFVLITNALTFLSFPSHWYEIRERQKNIFSTIHHYNYYLPMGETIPIPVEDVAFSKASLEANTLLMLRGMGIISSERKICVVPQESYEAWRMSPVKNDKSFLLTVSDVSQGNVIDFSEYSYPDFIVEVSGMSGKEGWGRWTDANIAPTAKFHFKQALPQKFTLELKASAFGPNIGVPIKLRVGKIEKEFTVTKMDAEVFRLNFEGIKNTDTIEIIPPKPTSPLELNSSNDVRKLGVGLVYLKILK